jgi:hypothetical protein
MEKRKCPTPRCKKYNKIFGATTTPMNAIVFHSKLNVKLSFMLACSSAAMAGAPRGARTARMSLLNEKREPCPGSAGIQQSSQQKKAARRNSSTPGARIFRFSGNFSAECPVIWGYRPSSGKDLISVLAA